MTRTSKRKPQMRITLKQIEIESALALYIRQQGINLDGKTLDIQFTAGRGQTGISAEVDMDNFTGTSTAQIKPLVEPVAPAPKLIVTSLPPAESSSPILTSFATDTPEGANAVSKAEEVPAPAPATAPAFVEAQPEPVRSSKLFG